MKKIFYVGVYLKERVHFGLYGFTSYVDCYTEAEDLKEAGNIAKAYFETKYKMQVTGTRPQPSKEQDKNKFAFPEQIINTFPKLEQPKLF